MLLTRSSVLAVVIAAVSLFGTDFFAEAQQDDGGGYQEIEGVPQSAIGLYVSTPFCIGHDEHPLIMWTIEPADRVMVSTNPPNLLTVKMNGVDKMLSFAWNEEIASTATGGGIKIGFPNNKFGLINVASSSTVQILDGFKEIGHVEVSETSVLTADLSSNEYGIYLDVSGKSKVTMISNLEVSQGRISGASDVTLEAPSLDWTEISGGSTVKADGDMYFGSLSGSSTLTITGFASGDVKVSDGSQVTISSCDKINFDKSSTCNSDPQTVDVTITEQPTTKTGTASCSESGNGVGDVLSDMVADSSKSTRSSNYGGIGIVAAVTVVAGVAML